MARFFVLSEAVLVLAIVLVIGGHLATTIALAISMTSTIFA